MTRRGQHELLALRRRRSSSACRRIPPSPRGELELPNAVRYAMRVMKERIRAMPVEAGVLDLVAARRHRRRRATALGDRRNALSGERVVTARHLAHAMSAPASAARPWPRAPRNSNASWRRSAASAPTTTSGTPGTCPGRIEVLGKHTDYGGGRSLICAAERGFSVVAAPRRTFGSRSPISDAACRSSSNPAAPRPDVSWATYPKTVDRARCSAISRDDSAASISCSRATCLQPRV